MKCHRREVDLGLRNVDVMIIKFVVVLFFAREPGLCDAKFELPAGGLSGHDEAEPKHRHCPRSVPQLKQGSATAVFGKRQNEARAFLNWSEGPPKAPAPDISLIVIPNSS